MSESNRELVEPERPTASSTIDSGFQHDAELVQWFLTLSPVERLKYAEGFARNVLAMRRATTIHKD